MLLLLKFFAFVYFYASFFYSFSSEWEKKNPFDIDLMETKCFFFFNFGGQYVREKLFFVYIITKYRLELDKLSYYAMNFH